MLSEVAELVPVVTVPARNEAQRLPKLIASLGQQTWLDRPDRRLRIIIVINNSTDGSADVARKAAAVWPRLDLDIQDVTFAAEHAHVGSARRLGMDRACDSLTDPACGVILTTDADAVPEPTWIDANLAALAQGADAVGGLLNGDPAEERRLGQGFLKRAALRKIYAELADRLTALIDPIPYDPWPRHGDHTGASLAVRAEAYAAVGGLPAAPFREDLAFVSRLRYAGYRLRHSPDARVTVSARLTGRAEGGMASCLRQWVEAEQAGLPLMVEDPDDVARRALRRRRLRHWPMAENPQAGEPELPDGLNLDGALPPEGRVEKHAPDDPDAHASMPAELAIAKLRSLIASWEETGRAA